MAFGGYGLRGNPGLSHHGAQCLFRSSASKHADFSAGQCLRIGGTVWTDHKAGATDKSGDRKINHFAPRQRDAGRLAKKVRLALLNYFEAIERGGGKKENPKQKQAT